MHHRYSIAWRRRIAVGRWRDRRGADRFRWFTLSVQKQERREDKHPGQNHQSCDDQKCVLAHFSSHTSFRFGVEVITPLLIDGFAVRRMVANGDAFH